MNKKYHEMMIKSTPRFYYWLLGLRRKQYEQQFKTMDISTMKEKDDLLYFQHVGKHVNWDNPVAYTEKMQVEKLFDKNPLKGMLADKYTVRKWVSERIGESYLVPLCGAGVYDNAFDIDFDKLPNSFVIKTNSGSGDAIIIRDKSSLSPKEIITIKAKMNYQLKYCFAWLGFELHYADIVPKILVETLIECDEEDLPDYKFLCFDGEPKFCWVDKGRYHNHKRNVYDLNWNLQDWNQKSYGNYEGDIPKPINFEKMIQLAKVLCEGFHHVRVDFYNVDGRIYFGEMTFTNGSGFEPIIPYEADIALGNMWNLKI